MTAVDLRGTEAGPYIIESFLGEGGMASVWRGRNRFTGRLAAIKVLHTEIARDPEQLERFLREARIATDPDLEHRNLVRVYEVAQLSNGQLYVAMELLDGSTLAAYLTSAGQQPADETLRMAAQAAAALERLHQKGVVHRDLKPENIFLTHGAARQVRVVDFGLAKVAPLRTATGSLIAGITRAGIAAGTPGYMAPEQAYDFAAVDERADIYSLGMVVFKMVTGVLPFMRDGEEGQVALSGILRRMVEMKAEPGEVLHTRAHYLPLGCREAILRAIAYDKDERFDHVREFCFAFAAHVDNGDKIVRAVAPEFFDTAPPTAETVPNPTGEAIPTQLMAVAPPRTGDTLLGAVGATPTTPPPPRASKGQRIAMGVAFGAVAVTAIVVASIAAGSEGVPTTPPSVEPAADPASAPPPVLVDAAPPPDAVSLRSVRIATEPPAAVVEVDGTAVGESPLTVVVPVGATTTVRATREGYLAAEQAVVITSATSDISLVLRPATTTERARPSERDIRPRRPRDDKPREVIFDPTKPIGPR